MTDPIDGARYRTVLGHFPTGVVVIAGHADDGPVGMSIGSFSSVSLDPPLVAFYPGKSSGSWPRIEATGKFCVNVLAEDQEEVCRVFAGKGEDKFSGIGWTAAGSGSPKVTGALAWIDCELERVVDAGDHWLVMGLVVDMDVERDDVGPLLFFRGGYGRVAP